MVKSKHKHSDVYTCNWCGGGGRFWAIFFIVVGVVLLARDLGITIFQQTSLWGIGALLIGIYLLFSRRK